VDYLELEANPAKETLNTKHETLNTNPETLNTTHDHMQRLGQGRFSGRSREWEGVNGSKTGPI
jgi:hypothetical protein